MKNYQVDRSNFYREERDNMAKFNDEFFDVSKLSKNDYMQVSAYLQVLLSKEEFDKLKEDWNKAGGYEVIPWWKFVFDNVEVKYNIF